MSTKLFKFRIQLAVVLGIGALAVWAVSRVSAADSGRPAAAPTVIEEGFAFWQKTGPADAFYRWQKGGLLENGTKYTMLTSYFRRMDRSLGNYKSFDVVEAKKIGESSAVIYVAMNFERTAVYGRFLLFRADKGWVVQNMDFSPRPEAVMQWLAFTDVNYQE